MGGGSLLLGLGIRLGLSRWEGGEKGLFVGWVVRVNCWRSCKSDFEIDVSVLVVRWKTNILPGIIRIKLLFRPRHFRIRVYIHLFRYTFFKS